MSVNASKAMLLPIKSLGIWKSLHKQSVRQNNYMDIGNRYLKGLYTVAKRSNDGISRSLDKINQSLEEINDTVLNSFNRTPPKIVILRDFVSEQSQQAGQFQQLAMNTMTNSKVKIENPPEEEQAKKVNWWKGLKAIEEKKPDLKLDLIPISLPKLDLKKQPVPLPSPSPTSKIMSFLKNVDVVKPFNSVKSLGEKAVKAAAETGDIADWNNLNDNADAALGKIGEKALGALRPVMDTLNEALISGQFMTIISSMANGFLVIANVIGMVVDGLLWLIGVIQSGWDYIKPVLEAIAIVYIAAMIVQVSVMIARVVMLAAAWMAANWPILLVVAAIALVLYILQSLGLTAGDVIGAIVGGFGWLWGVIQNVGIFLYNTFNTAWDAIVNAFNTSIDFVQQLLFGLATKALDVLYSMTIGAESFAGGFMKVMAKAINWVIDKFNSMIDALSQIPLFDDMGISKIKVDKLEPEIPHAASDMIDKYRQGLKALEPTMEDRPKRESNKLDYVDLDERFKNSRDSGKDFLNKFTEKGRDATKKVKNAMTPGGGMNQRTTTSLQAGQGGNLNNINRVNEVGKINGSVNISSDDLKLLRDLAEIQAIQNFVELAPTVQVTTGNINNAGDIDTIIDKIGQKLNEQLLSSAQGVYI